MFFNLVRENSKKNRKENSLFFISLIVSIVAFYIILSLKNQDVIKFLSTMESDAVNKLLLLVPVLYGVSLFILFFLVYFAGKYQLERRSHELGMYLMLGMQRKKLFCMLIAEEIYNSFISLAIGIPIAVLISEIISMVTIKLVGIGIIGHKFSFSISSFLWTCIGYFFIRLLALLISSGSIAKKDVTELLSASQERKNKTYNKVFIALKLSIGLALLVIAYALAISGMAWGSMKEMAITVIIGICGTFLLFHGVGIIFEVILKKKSAKNGLEVFTFRQIQENIFLKSNSLAVSSLLVLMALCCFAYGVAISINSKAKSGSPLHYTFNPDQNMESIEKQLDKAGIDKYLSSIFEVNIGHIREEKGEVLIDELVSAIKKEPSSEDKDVLLNNMEYFDYPHIISLSGFNKILKESSKESLVLNNNQVAFYRGADFSYGNTAKVLEDSLKGNPKIQIYSDKYQLVDKVYQESLVTDRVINIGDALIVNDELFKKLTDNDYEIYVNAILKSEFVEEKGLMNAISDVNKQLNSRTSLAYESYIQNMGRELFYVVAASYTSIYLAVIFLIIANTVIGVQFLMQQQKTVKRYKTMIKLGCSYDGLCKSARKQIKYYFSLPIIIAGFSSIFGVKSLFTGVSTTAMKGQVNALMIIAIAIIIILCMVEFIYMRAVMRISDKKIYSLIEVKREID